MTPNDEPPPLPEPTPAPKPKRRARQMDETLAEARANIEEYADDLRQLIKKLRQRWWH